MMHCSHHTLLTVYDVLHAYCLHGTRQSRDYVIDYLYRASPATRTATTDSRLRAFERFKAHLKALGIAFYHEQDHANELTESWLVIVEPEPAKRRVEALLNALST